MTKNTDYIDGYKLSLKDNILTVSIDLSSDLGISKSGKSKLVATSKGNMRLADAGITLGFNAYRPV